MKERRRASRNRSEALFEEFLDILRKKNKLEVIGDSKGTRYSNMHYRLDMQEVIILYILLLLFLHVAFPSGGG